jgi:quercetin dioxygenase-like cupin family protein
MKTIATAASAALLASLAIPADEAAGQSMKSQTINRAGAQPSAKGPAEYFTGNVRVDPLFPANASAPYSGADVTFEPGGRSNWHTHPTGQHLLVTHGVGRTQEWGGPIVEIRAGDHVWCPPRRQALARRLADERHDAYRPHRNARRQERRVDGTSHQRAIWQMSGK